MELHPCDVMLQVGRVRHSVAIFGQRLMVCDQSMREKAWRSRKPGLRAHAHSLPVGMFASLHAASQVHRAIVLAAVVLIECAHVFFRYANQLGRVSATESPVLGSSALPEANTSVPRSRLRSMSGMKN